MPSLTLHPAGKGMSGMWPLGTTPSRLHWTMLMRLRLRGPRRGWLLTSVVIKADTISPPGGHWQKACSWMSRAAAATTRKPAEIPPMR